MSVTSSVSTALSTLKQNPVLFVAAFFVSLVSSVVLGVQSAVGEVSPFLVSGLSFVVQFVSLFFVAGAYAMADEALDGRTSLGTLFTGGKENYVSMLGATLLLVGVMIATFIPIFIVGFIVIFGAAAAGGGGSMMVLGIVLIYLLALLPVFFLQFYGPAVVVSDTGAVGSLKKSFGLVRRNVLATLGFDVVVFVIGVLSSLPTVWLYVSQFEQLMENPQTFTLYTGLSTATIAGYLVSTLLMTALFGGFMYTYQVAFYGELVERTDGPGKSEDAGVAMGAD